MLWGVAFEHVVSPHQNASIRVFAFLCSEQIVVQSLGGKHTDSVVLKGGMASGTEQGSGDRNC